MYGVVNEGGTGGRAIAQRQSGGKTGTAQVAATEKTKGPNCTASSPTTPGSSAFAPVENPEIAVVALFENGVESYNAVPIVRDVLKAYFDKKAREENRVTQNAQPFQPPRLFAWLPVAAGVPK